MMITNFKKGMIYRLALALPVFFTGCTEHVQDAHKPYNILFIAADDLNTDLGTYGHPLVQSPNLDRLAKRGVLFRRAYCQYPLCNPTRASMLTGLNPDRIRVYDLQASFRDVVPDAVTLPQLFKENGYRTVRIGKIFHYGVPGDIGTDGKDDPVSWNKVINPKGRDVSDEKKIVKTMPVGLGVSLSYLSAEGKDEEQTDGMIATDAIKELSTYSRDKQPFFLAVGFFRPHTPYVAPKKYFDMYPPDRIALPDEPANDLEDIPQAALWTKPANWGLSEADRKAAIRGYYAATSFMDAQLGRVLDALDSLKLSENTIVVFWGDHGFNLGEHGQWQKRSLFEKSARVPLVISVPGGSAGTPSDRTVELVDVYPTLADYCDLKVKGELSGKSLLSLLKDPASPWDRPAFTQVHLADKRGIGITRAMGFDVAKSGWDTLIPKGTMGRSIRTEQWRYTEWDNGRLGTELYDELSDPGEIHNLASDKRYAEDVKTLSHLLREHFGQ